MTTTKKSAAKKSVPTIDAGKMAEAQRALERAIQKAALAGLTLEQTANVATAAQKKINERSRAQVKSAEYAAEITKLARAKRWDMTVLLNVCPHIIDGDVKSALDVERTRRTTSGTPTHRVTFADFARAGIVAMRVGAQTWQAPFDGAGAKIEHALRAAGVEIPNGQSAAVTLTRANVAESGKLLVSLDGKKFVPMAGGMVTPSA
jgi:hypothetical protein